MKEKDMRKIQRLNKDGTITIIEVDWNKMPCKDCEWRWSLHCPHGCWNASGQYNTYY